LREALNGVVLRDDCERVLIGPKLQVAQEIPDIVLIMKLGADPEGKALLGQQVLRLCHYHAQVRQCQERCEASFWGQSRRPELNVTETNNMAPNMTPLEAGNDPEPN